MADFINVVLFMQKNYKKRCVLRFRRFSRKSYSAFRSLHREVTIGRVASYITDRQLCKSGICGSVSRTAAMLLAALFGSGLNVDADDGVKNVELSETVVEASLMTRTAPTFGVGSSVEGAEIQLLPVNNVNEVISSLPGVDLRTRGAGGAQADLSIRGGTFDQVLILLNGVNITDPRTGHANMDIPLNLSVVDRIDVMENISSSTFGLTAFSGAVNFLTNINKENSLTAGVSTGMYGFVNPYLRYKLKKGEWRYLSEGEVNILKIGAYV